MATIVVKIDVPNRTAEEILAPENEFFLEDGRISIHQMDLERIVPADDEFYAFEFLGFTPDSVREGDVIQIGLTFPNKAVCGLFAFVEEVRNWGVIANVPVHGDDRDNVPDKVIPLRVEHGQYGIVGPVPFLLPAELD